MATTQQMPMTSEPKASQPQSQEKRQRSPFGCAVVGMPVQYHDASGPRCAMLHRRSKTQPHLWDVLVFLGAMTMPVVRAAIRQSEASDPKEGTWTFLPV